MKDKFYKHLCRNYHSYSIAANLMIALSIAGFALLGILTTTLTGAALISWGFLFAAIYGIGKLLDQEVDDLDKVKAHTKGVCPHERDSLDSSDSVGD